MRLFSVAFAATLMLAGTVTGQTLDRIKETKTLNLGYRTDAAPLSFADEAGVPSGYSLLICGEIAQAIADALQLDGLNAKFVAVDASNRFDMVASGKVDLLCGAATITLRRRNLVDFSAPTYVDGTSFILPAGASTDLRELAGGKIGFRNGTTTEEAVTLSFNSSGVDVEFVPFDSHTDGFTSLKSGEINAYFADQSILLFEYVTRNMGDAFQIAPEILTIEKHGLAMARGDSDFRLLVDTVLSGLYADGSMRQLFQKILPGAEPGQAMQAMYLMAPTMP
jgi:ABC-type amino acid transport substrate-binding protein